MPTHFGRQMFFLVPLLFVSPPSTANYENETVAQFLSKQTALADFLLKNYRQELPPLYLRDRYDNTSRVANLTMMFTYGKVLELNEPEQYIHVICGSYVSWTDFRLQWKPEDWAGIRMLMINRAKLWVPDVMPVDLIDYDELGHSMVQNVVVFANGSCSLLISAIFKLLCQLNIKEFPFDQQTCSIMLSSANFLTSEMQLFPSLYSKLDMSQIGNGAWKTTGLSMRVDKVKNYQYGWYYPQVIFNMTLKRSSIYYVIMIILPSLILTTLTVLSMFWEKIDDSTYLKKLSLGFSAFLSQTLLLQITTQNMPKTSHLPAMSTFILWNLIVLTASIVAVLVTAKYVRYRSQTPLPETTNRCRLLFRKLIVKAHTVYKFLFLLAILINLLVLLL